MKKTVLLHIFISVLGSALTPSFAHSNTCEKYFRPPMITQIGQLTVEQLKTLQDLASLEIELRVLSDVVLRSARLADLNEKLEEIIQSGISWGVYQEVRLEILDAEILKQKKYDDQLQEQKLQLELLRVEAEILKKYNKKNLAEVLHRTIPNEDLLEQDRATTHTIFNNSFLLKRVDIKIKEANGYNLLHKVFDHFPVESDAALYKIVEKLLNLGINVNEAKGSETPVQMAATFRDISILKLLLENGATISTTGQGGMFLLHDIAGSGEKMSQADAKIKFLISTYAADINQRDDKGRTPLYSAIDNAFNNPMIDVLIQNGANVELKDDNGLTPFQYLVEKRFAWSNTKIEKLLVLLKNKIDVNVQKNNGKTALHSIAKRAEPEFFETLVQAGVKLDVKDDQGKTALHYAVQTENLPVVQILIKNKADLNIRDNHGKTALEYVTQSQDGPLIKSLLIQNGAL